MTGHTSPLGKVLYEHLSKTHSVAGFSRSNGYEMPGANTQIIRETIDADVFLNCAYPLDKNARGSLKKYSQIQNTFLGQLYNQHFFGKSAVNIAQTKMLGGHAAEKPMLIISFGSSFIHLQEAIVAASSPGSLGFYNAKKEHAAICNKKYLCELQLGMFDVDRDEDELDHFALPVEHIIPTVDFVMDSYFNRNNLINCINFSLMT